MNYVNVLIRIFILLTVISCSFRSIKPLTNQEDLPNGCEHIIFTIEKNWKQNRKLKYYEYNEEVLTVLQRDYIKCLTSFNKENIIELLGNPTENLEDYYIYYALNEGCINVSPHDCKILTFHFKEDNGKLYAIQVLDQNAITHNK